jgi:hypothetical protein
MLKTSNSFIYVSKTFKNFKNVIFDPEITTIIITTTTKITNKQTNVYRFP